MRLKHLFVFYLFLTFNLHAQQQVPVKIAKILLGKQPYALFFHNYGVQYSPKGLSIVNGKMLFISQIRDGILFDIKNNNICGELQYPQPDYKATFENGLDYTFIEDYLVSSKKSPTLSSYSLNEQKILNFKTYEQIEDSNVAPYHLYSSFVFYCKDKKLRALTDAGEVVDTPQLIERLLAWHASTWYRDPALKLKHEKLIKTGEYLIVDGIFYPSVAEQAVKYFEYIGKHWEVADLIDGSTQMSFDAPAYGMSLNGDIYFYAPHIGVAVYDQTGRRLSYIDTDSVDRMTDDNSDDWDLYSSMLFAIHPNGDMYSLQEVKGDSAYFYKAAKTWGTDYTALARGGVKEVDTSSMTSKLAALSSQELMIIRNTLFALHGYAFESWDLESYFNGYDWYTPDPYVKGDASILNAEQKRLLGLIIDEESRRKL